MKTPGVYITSVPAALGPVEARNPGIPLDLEWVNSIQVNRNAVNRRCSTLVARRSVKGIVQTAWLLKAVTCMDLTTLSGDDTPGAVQRLCVKAIQPVRQEILASLHASEVPITVGAVCVFHGMVETAVKALRPSEIPVAAVSAGFPHGLSPMSSRLMEIKESVEAGAREIDIVITRRHVLLEDWSALFNEVSAFRQACGDAHLKAILATGELGKLSNVAKASVVAMMAGADFIKTSTGKESENATLPVGLTMVRQIREYFQATGYQVGFKPAGGIRTAKQAMEWLMLIKEELGHPWMTSHLFRFGASSLLGDIERQLEHHVTGAYAASWNQPMG
jgi:deoxyribose-phosphate aldolase